MKLDESASRSASRGLGIFKTAYDWDWAGAEKELQTSNRTKPELTRRRINSTVGIWL
ncbi:MAG: hypothetical protein WKF71_11420 [Pyrinomonadaceae bacterium]